MSQRALILRALIVGSGFISMFGCIRYTPFIATDEQPSPEDSYLYGRFKVEKSSSRIGLVVKQLDGETTYCIRYTPEGLGAIRVEPGEYALDHYKFQVGGVRKLPVPDVFRRPFTVEKGKAYYIGNFKGATKTKFIPLIIVDYWEHEWRADAVTYDYAGTTEAFRRAYPSFAAFPCEQAFWRSDTLTGQPDASSSPRPGGTLQQDGVVRSTDGKSQVRLPADWSIMSDLNSAADLQIGNHNENVYFIVLAESKDDFADNITYLEHARRTLDKLRGGMPDAKTVHGPTDLVIGGRPAVQYEVHGTRQDLRVIYLHTTVDGARSFHQLVAWALRSQMESNRKVMEDVISSFTETK